MQIAVCTDAGLRKELEEKELPPAIGITWVDSPGAFAATAADVYIDLLFEHTKDRVACLAALLPRMVIVNAVADTLQEIGRPFIRINAWPGFLGRKIAEIAVAGADQKESATALFAGLNWPVAIVPDLPGMVVPRVVAMIVNEAYFALQEKVSTKEEIDVAMKLGTHYPHGPFEWSRLIGLHRIHTLLMKLNAADERYHIAPAMTDELQQAVNQ